MDKDRLERLRVRMNRAQTLAEEISALEGSKIEKSGLRLSMTNRNDRPLLGQDLLLEIIEIGRDVVLSQKEAELDRLLSVEPTLQPALNNEQTRRILAI